MTVNNEITNPGHYTNGKIECIDAIKSALTTEEFIGYCKGNIIKYVWRESRKGGCSDIAKAGQYADWLEDAVRLRDDKYDVQMVISNALDKGGEDESNYTKQNR
jgi:hypothetical protein